MCVCVCKQGLALNNTQGLICHKTQPNQTKPNQTINICLAQIAGAVEYTEYISAEGYNPHPHAPISVLDMTLNHLMARLQA